MQSAFQPTREEQRFYFKRKAALLEQTSKVRTFEDWSTEWRSLSRKVERAGLDDTNSSLTTQFLQAVATINHDCYNMLIHKGQGGRRSLDQLIMLAIEWMRMHQATQPSSARYRQAHATFQGEESWSSPEPEPEPSTADTSRRSGQLATNQRKQKVKG